MTWGRVAAAAAIPFVALLTAAGCARKPAQKAEAGQVAAPTPLVTPTTEEGCRACNGVFGQHGIEPTRRCNCRTADAGKKCRGKDDCEGECLGDGGDRQVTQPGPPPLGFWIGRCAELRATFGCHVFLPRRSAQPVRLDEAPQQLCAD